MAPPRKIPRLLVVFDTNAIRAQSADEVVTPALSQLIDKHSHHGDLAVQWIVPQIVRDEREHQLRLGFREVLKPLAKAKDLLSLDIELSEETLHNAISNRVNTKLRDLKIVIAPCDHSKVDWEEIARKAAFRTPPFEHGDKEKGFKDALVCETFHQLSASVTGKDAIVLVSNDALVLQAVLARDPHARVLKGLSELNDDIALKVAHVDSATQEDIESKASKFLLDGDNAFWTRCNLTDFIWERYLQITGASSNVERAAHSISHPRLTQKVGNRVSFSNIYSVSPMRRVWVRTDAQLPSPATPATTAGLFGLLGPGEFVDEPMEPFDVEIRWSATFNRRRTLTHAKLENIEIAVAAKPTPEAVGNALLQR